jgi:hypothetical protein
MPTHHLHGQHGWNRKGLKATQGLKVVDAFEDGTTFYGHKNIC